MKEPAKIAHDEYCMWREHQDRGSDWMQAFTAGAMAAAANIYVAIALETNESTESQQRKANP